MAPPLACLPSFNQTSGVRYLHAAKYFCKTSQFCPSVCPGSTQVAWVATFVFTSYYLLCCLGGNRCLAMWITLWPNVCDYIYICAHVNHNMTQCMWLLAFCSCSIHETQLKIWKEKICQHFMPRLCICLTPFSHPLFIILVKILNNNIDICVWGINILQEVALQIVFSGPALFAWDESLKAERGSGPALLSRKWPWRRHGMTQPSHTNAA